MAPARFACAVPAAPRALPGWGLAPQTSRAAPPGAPSRTGPLLPGHPAGGVPARVRLVAGVVNRLRLSTLDAQPLPLSPWIQFFKSKATERGQAAGLSTGGRQSL